MTNNPYDPQQPQQPNQPPQWQPGQQQQNPQQQNPQQGRPQGPPQQYGQQQPGPQQPGPQQQWPQQPGPQGQQPSYGQPAYGQGQQPQQGYAPQPQFQQQPGNQQYQQQYAQQPYGAPPVAATSPLPKVLGWLMALFAVIAIACCFGPWASAKASSTELPISMTLSVNAFNHDSCSGSSVACDSAQEDDSSSSSSPSSPTGEDEDGSIWEGWVIAVIGAAVIVLGVLRGLGKRALSVPAAVVAAVGGLAVTGLTIYRWSWVHDKAGEAKDAMAAAGSSSKVDVSFGTDWGLWLTLVAGVLLLLSGVGGLVKRQ